MKTAEQKIKYDLAIARWRMTHPWFSSYMGARKRCLTGGVYFKRGFRFSVTQTQVGEVWMRDKAYLLERPSIDRIDSSKGYTYDNIQFIELMDNLLKHKIYTAQKRTCMNCGESFTGKKAKLMCNSCVFRVWRVKNPRDNEKRREYERKRRELNGKR